MKRIIVDHKKLTQELALALIEKYPQGYGDEDIITFKNARGEWVEAVELCAGETCYLVKISQSLSNLMADFEILHNNEVRKKAKLYLYSPNITKDKAEQMNFEYVENLEEFIESYNLQKKKIGRLRSSTFIVPYIKSFD